MPSRIVQFVHTVRDILIRDLTWDEFNKSFNEDMRGMYEFYSRSMKSVEGERNRFRRAVKFSWHMFVSFLMKLTPARRIIYAIAFLLFLVTLFQHKDLSIAYSFGVVSFLLAMELADKLITKDELEIARDIQMSLQPGKNAAVPGYGFAASSEAAKQVGGDYYDILTLSDASSLIVIGDVSGKGISSALYAVKIQTALQLFAVETNDPKELLIKLNTLVYGQLKRNYFLSLLLVKLYEDGKVDLCRAGHPPALQYRAADRSTTWLKPGGLAVGMTSSSNGNGSAGANGRKDFEESLEVQRLQLEPQDILFLFTDGLTETVDRIGREFGLDRVTSTLGSCAQESVENIRTRFVDALERYRGGADLRDDTTFVILRRLEKNANPV